VARPFRVRGLDRQSRLKGGNTLRGRLGVIIEATLRLFSPVSNLQSLFSPISNLQLDSAPSANIGLTKTSAILNTATTSTTVYQTPVVLDLSLKNEEV